MKNIAAGGVLERIRKLAPQHVTAPYRTVDEWREWQLAEGRKRSEEINRQNRQIRVEKIMKRVIVVTVADVMLALHGNYDNKNSGEKFLQGLCEVDLLVLDEIGMQRDTRNEQVTLNQIVDRRTASMHSVGMLTNLNHAAMNTLLGERVMDRMTMNGGRWVNFNWESWRSNVSHLRVVK
ncbi:TPA: ATP-binding protein [Escherichia coli]|nr:ATP-binding protein [Escherichia coli]